MREDKRELNSLLRIGGETGNMGNTVEKNIWKYV